MTLEHLMKINQSVLVHIHDDAEELAGFDLPIFLDGDYGQLDLPVEEQDFNDVTFR